MVSPVVIRKLVFSLRGLIINKKGFTIIELLVVLTIIITVSSIALYEIKNYNNFLNEIDVNNFNDEFLSFTNFARLESKSNESSSQILFSVSDNEIGLYEKGQLISKLTLPYGFKASKNTVNTTDGLIYIDEAGAITTSCSLQYIDREGKPQTITIGVGTNYVNIK